MNRKERQRIAKSRNSGPFNKLSLAYQHRQSGQFGTAEILLYQVLREFPEHPEAMQLLGEVLTDLMKTAEAIVLLRRLVELYPRHFVSHYTLGNAYRLAEQPNNAIICYQTALNLNLNFAGAHHGLGLALRAVGQDQEAVEQLSHAVRAMPNWAVAWKDLGLTLAMGGDLSGAEHALRRAIILQPLFGEAHRHLASLRRDDPNVQEIAALTMHTKDPRLSTEDRIELEFALGRLAEAREQFDDAFNHFTSANALLRAQQVKAGQYFDRVQLTRTVNQLIDNFQPEVFDFYDEMGDGSETPVFIVGMPRAGSTLLEQIAASHSQIFGAGECDGIGKIARTIGSIPSPDWQATTISAHAQSYLNEQWEKSPKALRIVDKMPDNIFLLGLISVLFPNSRVIFCQRDARDIALSCFF